MDRGFYSLIDLFVLGSGFYALYGAFVLKRDGKVIRTFLLPKDVEPSSCKDLQAYANLMAPKLQILGIAMIVYGLVSLLNTYVVPVWTLFWVMMAAFFLVLIWYGIELRKATKRYFP